MESLETARMLKDLGVSICFEEDHLDTATMSSEALADTEKRSGTGRFTVHFEKYEARRPYEDEKRYVYHQYDPLRI